MKKKLSVVYATLNEEINIVRSINSIKEIADDIVVVDENSTDKTREIARSLGARVFKSKHEPIFHVTKQKALDLARGDWILQLDADEVVTPQLAKEIKEVVNLTDSEIKQRIPKDRKKEKLFHRHQKLLEKRDGVEGGGGEIVAFYLPRVNMFLGRPLIHAGVYPDGVIRLVKKGFARFPAKSVHEQIKINGEVAWLYNDLEHHDSPTMSRYLTRLNRYTDLHANELDKKRITKNILYLIYYSTLLPLLVFLKLYFRHKGFLDGYRGFLWCFFSASHYPIAYFKYYQFKRLQGATL